MNLLRIVLNGEDAPTYTIKKAFERHFDEVDTIWWQDCEYDLPLLNKSIRERIVFKKYDVVFMQIQRSGVIDSETAKCLAENSLVFNWTGDVREDVSDYARISAEGVITLFTNMTDVEKIRSLGLQADYLQIGYDNAIYHNMGLERNNDIVFCGNYYPNEKFPLSYDRVNTAKALSKEFGESFKLYGNGWEAVGIKSLGWLNNQQEANVYNSCSIAISHSHFDYQQYFSDRLLREMACGALCLSHRYQDVEKDFQDMKHLVCYNDTADLIEKCYHYLGHREELERIAFLGQFRVSNSFNWDVVVNKFILLCLKYKK